jgi:hypothetical protein
LCLISSGLHISILHCLSIIWHHISFKSKVNQARSAF